LKFLHKTRGYNDRNFKSTALAGAAHLPISEQRHH
jgi:hypothetical protein